MTKAHDLYAETNPAFGAVVLEAFVSNYQDVVSQGPHLTLAYLVVPIALAGDTAASFNGTNKNTGLLEWLERQPMVRVGFDRRVRGTVDLTAEAIRVGCLSRVLSLGTNARLTLGPNRLKKSILRPLDDSAADAVRHAGRLGHWFAGAGSERNVFGLLGVEP